MPLISLVIPSEQSYTEWAFVIDDKKVPFGLFLGDVVNFLIVAAVLFVFIVKFWAGSCAPTRRRPRHCRP